MPNRTGKSPKRRIVEPGVFSEHQLRELVGRVRYVGSGHHKRWPADYGFERTSPRPTKSLCDIDRAIPLAEAQELLNAGILKAMVSQPWEDGFPKYVWSVSATSEVFEAKTHPNTPGQYHGYPLLGDDDMRELVLSQWRARCQEPGL
jgi:hypothetical protein